MSAGAEGAGPLPAGAWSPPATQAPGAPPGREEVELYTRTFQTLLRSSGEVPLRALERTHLGMRSSLHPLGGTEVLDSGALLYSLHRLPPVTLELRRVLLGQSPEQLLQAQAGSGWAPAA
ncbi:MAG: DUF6909 family protein, partial [Candidatus Dormibacteria bacterium]